MNQGLAPGTRLKQDSYRIEKVLGQGTFGITYLAVAVMTSSGTLGQIKTEVRVAIKEFFMSDLNSRDENSGMVEGSKGSIFSNYRKKFKKEAENLSHLSDSNIVKVYDIFDQNNTTYYVMEYLEGKNLDEFISAKVRLPEGEALKLFEQIAHAVDYMHSRKMLHLDLKPKNIMVDPTGQKATLIDFGLSKQFSENGEPETSTTIGLGTPGYAPPEQANYKQGGTFPATMDVYALGATLFKMLTGVRPPDATEILNDGFPLEDFKNLSVSGTTLQALQKAMSPTTKNRYKTVKEIMEGLRKETVINPEPDPVPNPNPNPNPKPNPKPKPVPKPDPIPDPVPEPVPNPINWKKWLSIVMGAAVVALVIVFCIRLTREENVIHDEEIAEIEIPETEVSNKVWASPLGTGLYSGEVMPDTLNSKINVPESLHSFLDAIPNGHGSLKIIEGTYKDAVYEGEFVKGKLQGPAVYTAPNGDIFKGTFWDNEFSEGTYTVAQNGEYFKGTFVNRKPEYGSWYDKQGKFLESVDNRPRTEVPAE